jgi:hypothetical protein
MRTLLVVGAIALAVLVAGATASGAAGTPGGEQVFRVRDTGIRCVRAPCFFLRARLVGTRKVVMVSELDLRGVDLTSKQRALADAALQKHGLLVGGRIVRASDGGRSLRASKVYLSR